MVLLLLIFYTFQKEKEEKKEAADLFGYGEWKRNTKP
jgi:hypothetical protein